MTSHQVRFSIVPDRRQKVPINDARTLVKNAFWGRCTTKQVANNNIGGKSLEKHWEAYSRERNPTSTSGFVSLLDAASSPQTRDGFREFAGKIDAQANVALTCLEILAQLKAQKSAGLTEKLGDLNTLIQRRPIKVSEDDEFALDKPIKELLSGDGLDDQRMSDVTDFLAQRLLPLTDAAVTELSQLWTKYIGDGERDAQSPRNSALRSSI